MIEPKPKVMRQFLDWLFVGVFEGGVFDSGDIQDKAEELGLLILCKVDRTSPEYENACGEYDTDELYFPYWMDEAQKVLEERKNYK